MNLNAVLCHRDVTLSSSALAAHTCLGYPHPHYRVSRLLLLLPPPPALPPAACLLPLAALGCVSLWARCLMNSLHSIAKQVQQAGKQAQLSQGGVQQDDEEQSRSHDVCSRSKARSGATHAHTRTHTPAPTSPPAPVHHASCPRLVALAAAAAPEVERVAARAAAVATAAALVHIADDAPQCRGGAAASAGTGSSGRGRGGGQRSCASAAASASASGLLHSQSGGEGLEGR